MTNGADAARAAEVGVIMSGGREKIDCYLITGIMNLNDSVDNLNENGCKRGQEDRDVIVELQKHIEARKVKTDVKSEDVLGWGKIKAWGKPAIILALALGIPWGLTLALTGYQIYHAKSVAAEVKQEAISTAEDVASKVAKRERVINANEMARTLREEVRGILLEEIKAQQNEK